MLITVVVYKHNMDFTEEQNAIISETTHSLKILAGAGSGKTTTMAAYVFNSVKSGRYKENEILFITFTRFAGQEIRNKLKKIAGLDLNIMTGTIHSAIFRFLNQARLKRATSTKLYDIMMEENIKFFLENLHNKTPTLVAVMRQYKLLVVDEFQDLDDNQFQFIKLFKAIQPELRIVAIGDLAQNIYRFRGTSNEFLRTRLQAEIEPNLVTQKLTTNFRSSAKILQAVNTIFRDEIREGHILPMKPSLKTIPGLMPKYFEYAVNPTPAIGEYEELVAKTILPIIFRGKQEQKSVVLLFPAIKSAAFNIITSLLREYSRKDGYNLDLHQISKEDTTSTTITFTYDPKAADSPAQFSSFHAAKGLEWDIVFVINTSDSMYDLRDYEEDTEGFIAERTNLLYVGLTRAEKELYIFANANMGGRHRLLAALGKEINNILDVTQWGEEDHTPKCEGSLKPISVSDLVRSLPQYPEIFARIKELSQNIKTVQKSGQPMKYDYVYKEMKIRNREMAFGTFIDWRIKQILCNSNVRCFQDTLLGMLEFFSGIGRFLSKKEAFENFETRMVKLRLDLTDSGIESETPLSQYVNASRYIALHNGKYHGLIRGVQDIVDLIVYKLRSAAAKENPTIKDQYLLSQARDFFTRGTMGEIQSIYAPPKKYLGLPPGLRNFVEKNDVTSVIVDTLKSYDISSENLQGDVALEFHKNRIIIGEMDLYTESNNGSIIELKCSSITNPEELRDTGNCKNLLQILTYVAMARHGIVKKKAKWAFLLNPLTSTYECYDLDTWSFMQSKKFIECLDELCALV